MSGPTPNGPTPSGAAAARLDPDPYWWEAAPRPRLDEIALPAEVDVAIVGSGITGLNAARVLARAGRRVLVLEAREPGWGASSRNAGYCGRTLKHSFLGLMEKRGLAAALAIYREMRQAYDAVAEVVRGEQIDCAYRVCGRFIAANSPRHYDEMARELAARREHLGDEFEMVPRAAQHREIGSDLYHGGALIPEMAALHPGRYHLGLLEAARRNGVEIAVNTAVGRVTGGEGRFELATSRGSLRARDVVVATNGYTSPAFPWLARRLMPFDAFMIATEPLPPGRIARALPNERTILDARHNIDFVRRSPDGRQILFGGRTGSRLPTPEIAAARLRRSLARIFPDLAGVRLEHSWTGRCAGTFDLFPHIGAHQGVHYALGYCFAGVPMGTHFGRKLAHRILGDGEGATAFDALPFPTLPLYRGNAWFMPPLMAAVDLLDAWHGRG